MSAGLASRLVIEGGMLPAGPGPDLRLCRLSTDACTHAIAVFTARVLFVLDSITLLISSYIHRCAPGCFMARQASDGWHAAAGSRAAILCVVASASAGLESSWLALQGPLG